MLRSTGFFRTIDCPYSAGAPGGPCRRPYCHFRHRGARGPGAPGDGGAAPPTAGLTYDPYNPELPKPAVQRENGVLGGGDEHHSDMLELELVNQAIEAVRTEVELEQRRYQELLGTARAGGIGEASALAPRGPSAPAADLGQEDTFPLSYDYHPGSHGPLSPDASYQPTPLVVPTEPGGKYSLERSPARGGALEYVPKAVGQPRRQGRHGTSGKYVVDNSKPSTDLEYDPLSNYSARLLNRAGSRDERPPKRAQGALGQELYTPALKKHCDAFRSYDARFSDSEDEAKEALGNGTLSASPPQARAGPESQASAKLPCSKGLEPEDGALRETKEMAVQYDVGDLGQQPQDPSRGSPATPASTAPPATVLATPVQGAFKDATSKRKRGELLAASHKDRSRKKDKGRAQGKPGERKTSQAASPRSQAEGPVGTKKKPSSATTLASSGKKRPERPPEPRPACGKRGKPSASGKLATRKAHSLDEGSSQDAPKLKQRALSHADLFGDESADEEVGPPRTWPPVLPNLSSDTDSDSDSSLSLPGAEQGPPRQSKASPPPVATPIPPSPSSSSSGEDVDYAALEKEVDFDSDPMEECLRIFNESSSVKTEDKGRLARQPPKEKAEEPGHSGLTTLFPGQKRRISHLTKHGKEAEPSRRPPPTAPARPLTAQEVCYRRAQQAQRESASWLQAAEKPGPGKPATVHISVPGEKKRIAHVPNPRLAAAPTGAKRTLAASGSQPRHGPEPGRQPLKTRTLAGMASKTTSTATPKRVAHSPSLQSLKKPIIPKEFGAKVPTAIRQRYLNLFIEECLKFCPSSQEAIEKALTEEKVAYDRSPSKNIYLNVAVNTLKKLRGLVPNASPGLSKTSGRRLVSHEVVLGGRLAAKTSFSLSHARSPRVEDLKGATLYSRLKEYLLTEEQLKENGYPFPHPQRPGGAVLFTGEEKKPKDASCRICCRCGAEYLVSPSGRCVRSEECSYHWGRLRRNRVAGGWETRYTCCSAAVGSIGCQVAKQHVQDGRKENLEGFVKTFEKELPQEAHPGVYALDCEMFSGVTEADLADTSITLRDVQAVLLSMLSADTILIGHSLESDLLALKVIHSTVVDTAVLFPHRLGLPYKRSLRNLMADYLRQIIQDNVDGHSSSEDASACMNLMIWKIREDAKTKR
ncbi:PREDICTED: RNA exonuclease 1 homolog [Elephantulus edwardii]|uniref:RNA exonuclease 1 homolog n=1 Tax=Elephantulus edwardii TaxID=28737 RepID=UPI0003F0ADDC|nr:PREDICTED: RNA exonuclease 1 homolog [Elephantulus edwardii]